MSKDIKEITYTKTRVGTTHEAHHFLLATDPLSVFNLDPFCVLGYLYSVAVDASIPLLFSRGVYRGSLSLVSSDALVGGSQPRAKSCREYLELLYSMALLSHIREDQHIGRRVVSAPN